MNIAFEKTHFNSFGRAGLHAILDGNLPRSWLTSWHWTFAYFILVGHQWHGARARASGLSSEGGLSRIYEPVLYMRPID